ncbi:MAG: hypothetical protein LVS60_07680 [Nodosilinea sp. LVE1205-7]|jgi:hypothetical protein
MATEESKQVSLQSEEQSSSAPLVEAGTVSTWLTDNGFAHEIAPPTIGELR